MRINPLRAAILLVLLIVPAVLSAQSGRVSGNFKNAPLKSVLEQIEQQTGCTFVYTLSEVKSAKPVTASFSNTEIKTVLATVLSSSFRWTVNGSMISLKAKQPSSPAPTAVTPKPKQEQPQKVTVIGTVVDEKSIPVIGAAVIPGANTSAGVMTDLDGRFSINVEPGTVLHFSSVGFSNIDYKVDGQGPVTITMIEESQLLNETVVVGYGIQKKESVVGAVSQVGTEALVNSGTTNITNSLAGKLSGVQTFQTSGQPGKNDAKIYIRGMSSWNNDDPLVMVDGIERSFSDLDPNEVETISVLKDASATAVFGAKGANGVILVTTRQGVKGKPKMHLSVDYGVDLPSKIPEHVHTSTMAEMANVAMKNQQSFASQYSDEIIGYYRDGSKPLRYCDNDWFDLLLKNFAQTFNTNYNVRGGGEKARYFVSVGYSNEDSIVKRLNDWNATTFNYHRINYRSNLDFDVTPTTKLFVKVGGSTGVTQYPDEVAVGTLFNEMYYADMGSFPAYFPESALETIKDWDYPYATGRRLSNNGSTSTKNPYSTLSCGDFTKTMDNRLSTDLELNQNLDMLVKGSAARFKVGFTSDYSRVSQQADYGYTSYYIDWNAYDAGDSNPWVSSKSSTEVDVNPPLSVKQYNNVRSYTTNFYLEGGFDYNRTFGRHTVTALALYNQRSVVSGTSFPRKNQGIVGRVTYDYNGKYLFEANVGYTGSEQFSPKNRFGFFPSAAVGYVISKERFWREAMPWWNKMKLRFSDGLVGTDSASARWLYYSVYDYTSNGSYREQSAANDTARWETSRKRDLGIEMGWFKDSLTLIVDLFNEHRTGMLLTPVMIPLVGITSKDTNSGELKKHGYEIEAKYRKTTKRGFYYKLGGMFAFNENRIVKYNDLPYALEYQKYEGKPYMSRSNGMDVIDDCYFNSIDEIHGYPGATSNWAYNTPGRYKYLDYDSSGAINTDDAHTIKGSTAPLYVYSYNLGFGYKRFNFNCLFYGNAGKYTTFLNAYITEFYKGDLVVHKSQLDYWTPTNTQASHQNLSYTGDGLTKTYLEGQTWRKSDYLMLKELYLSYKFDGDKLHKIAGIRGLSITATANNLLNFTSLIEGDPQRTSLEESYYPMMRILKLGIKLDL